jgi:hypothetical protein
MHVTQRVQFSSGGRYPVLRSIAIIYLFLGGIAVIGGVMAMLWLLLRAPFTATDRVILAAAALVGSVFCGALMLGAAEIIKLFVDLEHNTRMAWMDGTMTPSSATARDEGGHTNRISILEEETAEAALIRGH